MAYIELTQPGSGRPQPESDHQIWIGLETANKQYRLIRIYGDKINYQWELAALPGYWIEYSSGHIWSHVGHTAEGESA